jgi:hypothetical protein
MSDDILTIDLFDANEHKRYGEFDGHGMCDPGILALVHKVGRCDSDSASVWLQGDDQEEPDMHSGLSGPDTKMHFMQAIRPFMSQ